MGVARSSSSTCGPCSLCCSLLKLILSLGTIAFVIWLIYRPSKMKVYVETATLTHFNLTNTNSTLNCNLTLDISIRNPNRRISFYYDYVEATALYDGSRLSYEALPTFYQGHKNTTLLHPAFQGQALALGSVANTFNREKGEGFFYVEVKLSTKLRLKVNFFKIGHFKPKIDCTVKLPSPSVKNSDASFERTKCRVNF